MKVAGALLALWIAAPVFAAKERKIDPQPARAAEPAVSIDVKDGEARDVLKVMQQQCGIKNLMIDPDVQGKATFYFREVPCHAAFDAVLTTYGLRAVVYSGSVAAVEKLR